MVVAANVPAAMQDSVMDPMMMAVSGPYAKRSPARFSGRSHPSAMPSGRGRTATETVL
jgi:hypothetical protein